MICLERGDECEPIVRAWSCRPRPELLRLPVGARARRRSAAERRQHREAALEAYFRAAVPVRLRLADVALQLTSDRAGRPGLDGGDLLDGMLVGLDDVRGDTLGLGAIRGIDRAERELHLDTPVRDAHVATLRLGHRAVRVAEPVR